MKRRNPISLRQPNLNLYCFDSSPHLFLPLMFANHVQLNENYTSHIQTFDLCRNALPNEHDDRAANSLFSTTRIAHAALVDNTNPGLMRQPIFSTLSLFTALTVVSPAIVWFWQRKSHRFAGPMRIRQSPNLSPTLSEYCRTIRSQTAPAAVGNKEASLTLLIRSRPKINHEILSLSGTFGSLSALADWRHYLSLQLSLTNKPGCKALFVQSLDCSERLEEILRMLLVQFQVCWPP